MPVSPFVRADWRDGTAPPLALCPCRFYVRRLQKGRGHAGQGRAARGTFLARQALYFLRGCVYGKCGARSDAPALPLAQRACDAGCFLFCTL